MASGKAEGIHYSCESDYGDKDRSGLLGGRLRRLWEVGNLPTGTNLEFWVLEWPLVKQGASTGFVGRIWTFVLLIPNYFALTKILFPQNFMTSVLFVIAKIPLFIQIHFLCPFICWRTYRLVPLVIVKVDTHFFFHVEKWKTALYSAFRLCEPE